MNITKKEMKAAFAEWKKRVEENPEEFMSAEEQLEAGPEVCSELSMEFFVKLVKEARKA